MRGEAWTSTAFAHKFKRAEFRSHLGPGPQLFDTLSFLAPPNTTRQARAALTGIVKLKAVAADFDFLSVSGVGDRGSLALVATSEVT